MKDFSNTLISHLISYKKSKLGLNKHGFFKSKEYDHILVEEDLDLNFLPSIKDDAVTFLADVKRHVYFDHLNSSQAACFNLFVPLGLDKELSNMVLKELIPEFNELLKIKFEYSDPKDYLNERKGKTGNNKNIGTDSDVAIFYLNSEGEKCLCLLEHKLSEKEFTNCNAIKSKNNHKKDKCYNFNEIWSNPDNCYYQSGKNYKYWELSKDQNSFFDTHSLSVLEGICPFKSSLQQLWRNMLMAQAIENDQENEIIKAYFGVVYHGENEKLYNLREYADFKRSDLAFSAILKRKEKFFTITIQDIITKIKEASNPLVYWVNEYEDKYINF